MNETDAAWERSKRHLVYALLGVVAGLAVAASVDATKGGILVLAAWPFAVVALHRLGRAGSRRETT